MQTGVCAEDLGRSGCGREPEPIARHVALRVVAAGHRICWADGGPVWRQKNRGADGRFRRGRRE